VRELLMALGVLVLVAVGWLGTLIPPLSAE
jgi:hypothetical protein